MSSAPSGALRRFVFLISLTGDEVLDGAAVEVRADDALDAIDKTASWMMVKQGARLSLIGERAGFGSDQRFTPCVPIDDLPMYIVQNEKFSFRHEKARLARIEREADGYPEFGGAA